mmetsp:Transcript_6505/g.13042  ORF Transcript_6505/g.13042 Transcript_6505/m.13042 type:complete len:197 (-) Transcript_6505:110-700(-)
MLGGLFGQPSDDEVARERYFGMRGTVAEQPALLQRVRNAAGMEPTQTEQIMGGLCPSLTFKQRLFGFGICFCVGVTLSATSLFSFTQLLLGHPLPFAVKYTCGNLLSLFSMCFLVGPRRQLRNMTSSTRWVAALVYLVAMALTLVSCIVFRTKAGSLIVLICIIVQFCAMTWYALSYIPFGRKLLRSCLRSAVDVS